MSTERARHVEQAAEDPRPEGVLVGWTVAAAG